MKQPLTISLTTEAGLKLTGKPWDAYPRPQLRRDGYINLNGEWDFAVSQKQLDLSQGGSVGFDKRILVPFPVESALSGVGEHFPEGSILYYRTHFTLDVIPEGKRLLLHCGGVDQNAEVLFNGNTRRDQLCPSLIWPDCVVLEGARQGENELVIAVTDDLRRREYPYGKQTRKRGGMWYTPVSGIWQTVWLEWVPKMSVTRLEVVPGLDHVSITVYETALPAEPEREHPAVSGSIRFEGKDWPLLDGKAVIRPEMPRLWSPEDPYLYDFTVKTNTDEVRSYFALRTIEAKTVDGVPRLCLNGKPFFFHGLLDQGYWPDGLYTPASPECYEEDILAMKRLGFNTLRKHIKVEPEQFYYDCDRLGMLVFQDMVNNGRYSFLGDSVLPTLGLQKLPEWLPLRRPATKLFFRKAMYSTVRRLYNHPCIVYWTIFNEGWGQFAASENYACLNKLDPTRIIDTTSGWFRGDRTDVESRHVYFKRFRIPKSDKPVILSEFGGYSCKIEGHSFNLDKTFGYRFFRERSAFMDALEALYREQIIPAIPEGLCGAVYTQVSDVEDETNGLLSYDRRVCKVDAPRMKAIAEALQM